MTGGLSTAQCSRSRLVPSLRDGCTWPADRNQQTTGSEIVRVFDRESTVQSGARFISDRLELFGWCLAYIKSLPSTYVQYGYLEIMVETVRTLVTLFRASKDEGDLDFSYRSHTAIILFSYASLSFAFFPSSTDNAKKIYQDQFYEFKGLAEALVSELK